MEPNTINMYCANCDPKRWMFLLRELVFISLDLERSELRLEAKCPICGHMIEHTRQA